MNSIKYIGTQVDTLIENVTGSEKDPETERRNSDGEPPQIPGKLTAWTFLTSLVFLQWGAIAESLSTRTTIDAERTLALSKSQETPAIEFSGTVKSPASLTRKPKSRSRASGSSVSLTRSPLSYMDSGRKTLVLDLDETLIHSMSRSHHLGTHMVEVELANNIKCIYYVDKRPYCDYFLSVVRQWFNLVVFTASVQSYADPMIDWLDQGKQYFQKRLYRTDCIPTPEGYVKDLTILGSGLGRVLLIDNSPVSYSMQKDNGIEIEGWISDPSDSCLLNLLPLLNALRYTTDVRSVLCLRNGEKD